MNKSLFYGKYRGTVVDSVDPLMLGRIRTKVPTVLGLEETGWALPSSPYGGPGVGFFFIPPVGANVWIEFEAGDMDHPIWSGCFWDVGEVPEIDLHTKVIKTDMATITIDDVSDEGGITIESISGFKIAMDVSGITLSNGAGLALIRLNPSSTSNAPTSGNHKMGELFVDNAGILYYCAQDGAPGIWRKVHLV